MTTRTRTTPTKTSKVKPSYNLLPDLRMVGVGKYHRLILEDQMKLERINWLEELLRRLKKLYSECHAHQDRLPYDVKQAYVNLGILSDSLFTDWPRRRYTGEFKKYVCDCAAWYVKHNRASKPAVAKAFGVTWDDYTAWEEKFLAKKSFEESTRATRRHALQQQQKLKGAKVQLHVPLGKAAQELQQLAKAVNDVGHVPKFVPPDPTLDLLTDEKERKAKQLEKARTIPMPTSASRFDLPRELL